MTVIERPYEFETLSHIWNHQLPMVTKLEKLKQYFNVDSLVEVPFWKLYKIVKKLNSF